MTPTQADTGGRWGRDPVRNEGMSGADWLQQLNSDALTTLAEFEGRIAALTRRTEALRGQLDAERRRLGGALETLNYHYRYPPPGSTGAQGGKPPRLGIDIEAIKRDEEALGQQLLKCGAFLSRLTSLANLLTISRNQFAPQGEAAPELDASRVVARLAMIQAQEDERYRLAREIHDGPAQVLANAILGLELCEQLARRSPEQLVDELVRLKGMLREGLVEVRRFIFDLRPATLAERGLTATLERYIAEFRAFFKLDVELQLPEALPALTPEQEITVFRIVQESLQNIQKHARATRVVVQLIPNEDALCAVIRDNGRGFVVQETETTTLSGVGLRGMDERAAAVGGTLRVESQPGEGSTVRLVLPWASTAGAGGGAPMLAPAGTGPREPGPGATD